METVDKVIRLFSLYIAAVVGAFALSICFWVLCFGSALVFGPIMYLPTLFYLILSVGIPLGSALGIYIQDKRKYKLPTYLFYRISTAFLFGIFCILLIRIWSDYVGGIGLLTHSLLGRHEGSAILLLPFVNAFFSLIGYHFISLFGRRKAPESETLPSIGIFSRLLPLGILVALVAGAIYLSLSWQKEKIDAVKEMEKANKFVEQFLVSINNDTDFYKTHSSGPAMQSIQANRRLISSNYERRRHSSEKGWYEYYIIFDGGQLFLAGIDTSGREFIMREFRYDGTATKMTWSDGVGLDEARKFLNKILSSIKDEKDFYKEHSEETALEGIQTYRSMIRGENMLPFRSSDGHNFYFYLMFDDQQVFEAIIKDSDKGFVVNSFTYIGKGNWPEWKLHQLDLGDIDRFKNRQKRQ